MLVEKVTMSKYEDEFHSSTTLEPNFGKLVCFIKWYDFTHTRLNYHLIHFENFQIQDVYHSTYQQRGYQC